MGLTIDDLVKMNACFGSVVKFQETAELHDIELPINELVTDNSYLVDDIKWLCDRVNYQIVKVLKYETSSGSWGKWTYDKQGNMRKRETSDGYWEKWTYDKQGNMRKRETSSGSWEKWTYDKQGNMRKRETSDGNWKKWTYDKQGNMRKYEDSDGYWEKWTYKAGKCIHVEGSSMEKMEKYEGKIEIR